MMYRELEQLERALEEASMLCSRIVAAETVLDAQRLARSLARYLNRIALPYKVEREARSLDRGDTFTALVLSTPARPRTLSL